MSDDTYIPNDEYDRLLDHLLDCRLGELLSSYRDEVRNMLTMALGLEAGVWAESTREAEKTAV